MPRVAYIFYLSYLNRLNDAADGGDALRAKLRELTKQQGVPFVFIGGKFIGSEAALAGMRGPKATIKPLLVAAGVTPTGFFRS
jgi:glutaredoxin-related protein